MNWNQILQNNTFRCGVSLLLCAALLMGLFLPVKDMTHARPENPLDQGAIREITVLKVGENVSDLNSIVVPGEGSGTSTEPPETEPPQTQPPEDQPPETQPPQTEPPKTEPPQTEPPQSEPWQTEATTPENTRPEDGEPEDTTPEDTQPDSGDGDQEPEQTTPEGGDGGEDQPTEPETPGPEGPPSDEPDPEDPGTGDGDEGNDDGNSGEEGPTLADLDLAAVMTWYKYGNEPNLLTCGPSESVTSSVNTAQIMEQLLEYSFSLEGRDSGGAEITSVTLAEGNSADREVAESGEVSVALPEGVTRRNFTFTVNALYETRLENGERTELEISFTFVLRCEHKMDLELELTWTPNEGNQRTVACGPNETEAFTVENQQINERVFVYSVELTGALAEDAQITDARYTTASGENAGTLAADSGTLILNPASGSESETYILTFTARTAGQDVLFTYEITYRETLDVELNFHWMEKGTTRRTKTCLPGESVTQRIKSNQLSAGAVPYELELAGADGGEGRILSVSYTADSGESGTLEESGSLPVTMPEGASSNTYRITVSAMVRGQRMSFEIVLKFAADVSLQMQYTVKEDGSNVTRQITCENTRSKTAEDIYDDQLDEGVLSYSMTLVGSEESNVSITSVTCYQSGSGRTVTLSESGEITLLLKDGKTGENTFEVEAEDSEGNTYSFTINIPYKHRGENSIQITTNLTDGQEVINEAVTNLTVQAWSEDENGNVISYIPANGTDTVLLVQLDGETLSYVSTSGASSEFDLYPANPQVGDTNTHTLYIYAEDALGNFGELTLTLNGQRRESGQVAGKATIYVDMTALGLGVVANLGYEVLADEPVSYVIAKAIMGMDTGEPYGAASESLGWSGRYAGTLDSGFYLQSLTTGHTATALEDSSWPGTTEEEALQAIDDRFGAGTGLATLWRCLYRNGLNKSSGSGNSFGEFDYTSGSGWMYSVGSDTYYPGQSMSSVYLQDGDVLTLRYTLAYGWDVGGGSPGYGNTVGYCVSAVNGSIRVSHQMETITNADGSVSNVCHCCGIQEACAHANMDCIDLGDGLHISYCNDCKKEIGDPGEHIWIAGENASEQHTCSECGALENHYWKEVEGSNTATCTEPGTRSVQCQICSQIREEETGPKGHTLDNQWLVTADYHYEKCSTCGEEANKGSHQYQVVTYLENGEEKEDYECTICHAWHIDECGGELRETNATCQKIELHCDDCGYDMAQEGFFEENHSFVNGSCTYCGEPDPDANEPEPEPEPQPEEGGESGEEDTE